MTGGPSNSVQFKTLPDNKGKVHFFIKLFISSYPKG